MNCEFCGQPLEETGRRWCGSRSCYLMAVIDQQKRNEDLQDFYESEIEPEQYTPRNKTRFSK